MDEVGESVAARGESVEVEESETGSGERQR